MYEKSNLKLNEYLSQHTNSKAFYEQYIALLVQSASIELEIKEEKAKGGLYIIVNNIQWCLINKNNSIQILPHGKATKDKIKHISDNKSVYDINNFLKDKKNGLYYISIIYKNKEGFEEEIKKILSTSLSFLVNVK